MADPVHAALTLKHAAGRVGAERIALIAAIGRTGSISAAAKEVGLSYKAAWDAVQVLNNLYDRPLVVPSTGGRDGGQSVVTEAGETVVRAFAAVEEELARALGQLEQAVAGAAPLSPLLWGPGLRTSARNALRGTVSRVRVGDVDAQVALEIASGVEIVATVTRDSVDRLGLIVGTAALALIKSSLVIIGAANGARLSARDQLPGIVVARTDGTVSSEIALELALGKTLTATLTREAADALTLNVGAPAVAMVKASHVVLALV
jgi:molybdate transport system regulatory protein